MFLHYLNPTMLTRFNFLRKTDVEKFTQNLSDSGEKMLSLNLLHLNI